MRRFLQRLRRLFAQSRIRLPLAEFRASELQPGDRLQIGSRLWRLGTLGPAGELELLACDSASARARLRRSQQPPAGSWLLLEDGRVTILQASDLLHFPCGPRGLRHQAETARSTPATT